MIVDLRIMPNLFPVPVLTRGRIWAAFLVAMTADAAQILLGPLGWLFIDQALDVAAMLLTTALLGFHPLLLPTFILELVPVADLLPSWTASVAIVVAMRGKQTNSRTTHPLIPPRLNEMPSRVIDV